MISVDSDFVCYFCKIGPPGAEYFYYGEEFLICYILVALGRVEGA
jgi:hypothetical protein